MYDSRSDHPHKGLHLGRYRRDMRSGGKTGIDSGAWRDREVRVQPKHEAIVEGLIAATLDMDETFTSVDIMVEGWDEDNAAELYFTERMDEWEAVLLSNLAKMGEPPEDTVWVTNTAEDRLTVGPSTSDADLDDEDDLDADLDYEPWLPYMDQRTLEAHMGNLGFRDSGWHVEYAR